MARQRNLRHRGPASTGIQGFDPDRGESELQRIDRNWVDLLQELRVLQTGIQILTGFLLTLPFQERFTQLSGGQVALYLCLVVLSVLITALLVSTVVLHRTFFQHRIKPDLVRSSDRLLRITLVLVGLVLIGTLGLVFDIVLAPGAGLAAALAVTAVLFLLWILFPLTVRRRALRRRDAAAGSSKGGQPKPPALGGTLPGG